MPLSEHQRAVNKAWREANKDSVHAAQKRWYDANGTRRNAENVDLIRAIKMKSYYLRGGEIEKAEQEQAKVDAIRQAIPRSPGGMKPKYSDEERVIRRKAAVRKTRYKHIKGIPFVAASFHGPTILVEPSMCQACGDTGKICMDHDHDTLQFRGWLCNDCNLILGHAQDDIGVLKALIRYLQSTK